MAHARKPPAQAGAAMQRGVEAQGGHAGHLTSSLERTSPIEFNMTRMVAGKALSTPLVLA